MKPNLVPRKRDIRFAVSIIGIAFFGFTGCSEPMTKPESSDSSFTPVALSPTAQAAAANSNGAAIGGSSPSSPEDEKKIADLNHRVEDLETRISALNDKVNSKALIDTSLKPVTVEGHPAADIGTEIEATSAKNDPDSGFIHDGAILTYRKCMILFTTQRYPESVLAFSAFVEKYPDHPLAGAAQYYIGESYYRQKEYKLALQEFSRVLMSYDRSTRVSETLREMAATEDLLKQTDDAAKHRELLVSLFPQSPAAVIASRGPISPQDDAPAPTEKPITTGVQAAQAAAINSALSSTPLENPDAPPAPDAAATAAAAAASGAATGPTVTTVSVPTAPIPSGVEMKTQILPNKNPGDTTSALDAPPTPQKPQMPQTEDAPNN